MLIGKIAIKPNRLSFRPESLGICKAPKEPQQISKDEAENCEAPVNSFERKALMSKSGASRYTSA